MTKDSIWAAMGPSASLSDDAGWSMPSSSPREGPSGRALVLPSRRGSAAWGAACRGGPTALGEDLRTPRSVRETRRLPACPPPCPRSSSPLPHTPVGVWLRALLGGSDCSLGVPCPLLCLLLAGQSDVLLGGAACGWQGPAGRLIFKVQVVLETCHHRVSCRGLRIAARRAGSQRSLGGHRAPTLAFRPGPLGLLRAAWMQPRGTSCQGGLGVVLWGGRHVCERGSAGGRV